MTPTEMERLEEIVAYAICGAQGGDPERMTYITDDGVMQPYGPAWTRYDLEAKAAIEATGVVELRSELLCVASLLNAIYRGEKIMEQFPQSVKHALSKAQAALALTQLTKGSE